MVDRENDHEEVNIEPATDPSTVGLHVVDQDTIRAVADAFDSSLLLDPADVAARVERLLTEMHRLGLHHDLPLNHFFTGQLYARELLIPAGTFAIGEIQKAGHVSIISRGEISMLNADGGFTRIKAPYTFVCEPGVRKCGFAHEDTVWTTVHDMSAMGLENPSQLPIDELESFLVARTPQEYQMQLPISEPSEAQS